jgi:hypothetical protein
LTLRAAPKTQRQGAEHILLRQVRHIEALTRQYVTLPERVFVAPMRGVEPLVQIHVKRQIDVFQAAIALAMDSCVHASFHNEHPIRLTQFKPYASRVRKEDSFERLDRHLVVYQHELATAGEQPADVDLVRTIHKSSAAQYETPPTRRGRHGLCHSRTRTPPCQTHRPAG